jgi:2-amino-4-hydroxy-6-hydroxymethyldihydropteridine diphosphokinase
MSERTGYLGLGSNLWDRRAHLEAATAALAANTAIEVIASSSVYETDPVGEIPDQPDFFNACLRIATSLGPEELLDVCKTVERDAGRVPGGVPQGPREVDVDVLLLGDLEFVSGRMHLPHPELLRRRFVLIPLLELDFDLATPSGKRLSDALVVMDPREGVRLAGPPLGAGQADAGSQSAG